VGSYHALVVVDMPFGAYEASPQQAFASASRIMAETGAPRSSSRVARRWPRPSPSCRARIPVMAHVGLTPQAVNALGGYGARGRTQEEHAKIISDGKAVQEAGAFAVVAEGVLEPIAIALTQTLEIPVIGIGASAQCDGQCWSPRTCSGCSSGCRGS
jgi:3-methyl-2-oxobutanoate hydroxymethyltransferase